MSPSIETLIEIVKRDVANGEDCNVVIENYVDSQYCSPEDAEQLREHFLPLIEINESEIVMDAPAILPSQPERSTPVLHIDWGMEVKPDVILSPMFTIQGGSLQHQPLVSFPLDNRIEQSGWQWDEIPALKRTSGGWSFHQQLQLKKAGQYLFEVFVIDPQPGFADPGYYHATFRMDVTDPQAAGQQGNVSIQVKDGGAANLEISRYMKHNPRANLTVHVDGGALNLRDESVVDKMMDANKLPQADDELVWTLTISFQSEPDNAQRVPYVAQPITSRLVHLNMVESDGNKFYSLTGGKQFTFGRDVPELSIQNDVPLAIRPGTQEENKHADEFALLNGLFSREHARLEVYKDGIYFVDCRQGGIQDATILDDHKMSKGDAVLLFPHDVKSMSPRNVLFSKMLSMKFLPRYDSLQEEPHEEYFPKGCPRELLNRLYSTKSFTGISSVCVVPEKYFKQKDHAAVLMRILQRLPQIAESDWWKQWFKKHDNADPCFNTHEYWFIPQFITLGRDNRNAIRLENRQWDDIRLRIMFVNNSLYIENITLDADIKFGVGEDSRPLSPFRPQPLCAGAVVRKGNAVLRFAE